MRVGVEAIGLAVPARRLSGELLKGAWGTGGKGARSVAAHDQDSVTLGLDASFSAGILGNTRIAGVYFASTTAPLEDGGNASQLAVGADLPESTHAIDLGGSLGAGANALLAAEHAVRAGAGQTLVVAGEVQSPEPGSVAEGQCGDGAVAVVLGGDPRLAEVLAQASLTSGIRERWRRRGESFTEEADRPFVQEWGFPLAMASLAKRVLGESGLESSQVRLALAAPDPAADRALRKSLRWPEERIVPDATLDAIGALGSAAFGFALARGLASSKPGDSLMVLGAGTGAHALLVKVGDEAPAVADTLAAALAPGRSIARYPQYLRMRGLIAGERLTVWSSPAVLARDERALVRWRGSRCSSCGAIELPPKPVCHGCDGRSFSEIALGREGRIVTFTSDHLVPNPDPPTVMASADLDGGGRYYAEVADAVPSELSIGRRVGLTFRRIHEGGGFPNYGWKLRLA